MTTTTCIYFRFYTMLGTGFFDSLWGRPVGLATLAVAMPIEKFDVLDKRNDRQSSFGHRLTKLGTNKQLS
jgi:hypothetical protein